MEPGRIDIGWVLPSGLTEHERSAVTKARLDAERRLQDRFPELTWSLRTVESALADGAGAVEPTVLLDEGVVVRDAHRFDFVLVLTRRELVARTRPQTVATPSRALGVAVLSVRRLAPDDDAVQLERRLSQLALRVVAYLAGAEPVESRQCVMGPLERLADLDEPRHFCDEVVDDLSGALVEIADTRLEEMGPQERLRGTTFYVRAVALNLRPILAALERMRPWLLPLRLGRLTAAAVSAVLILISTAEGWDLAAANGPTTLVPLSLLALLGTSTFLLLRHRLVIGHAARRTEQGVVSEVSVILGVVVGMLTTYVVLLLGGLSIGALIVPPPLVASWISQPAAGSAVYLRMATLAGSLGLLIGALGASFEAPHALRHAAYVDEEI